MTRFAYCFISGFALLLALPFFALSIWLITESRHHRLDVDEYRHVAAARQFIESHKTSYERLPDYDELSAWMHKMDVQGYRFDGKGFSLNDRCTIDPLEFCIYFWTGDVWVTIKSWQPDWKTAEINEDGGRLLVFFISIAIAIGLVILSIAFFTSGRSKIEM